MVHAAEHQGLKFLLPLLFCLLATRAEEPALIKDIVYARTDGHELKFDLYQCGAQKGPLILWVHGGAWRSGSKSSMPLRSLLCEGYPIASVDYRLSTTARFPAQIHDLKAAVRFLRSKAEGYQINAQSIVVAGDSAGGHLAALLAVSNGHEQLEGKVGNHLDQSSDVQGGISFYGAANLTTILSQSTPHGLEVRVPALDLLLGGDPATVPALARLASPVFHVDKDDPPLLLLHGDQDPQMPINQAHELLGACKKAGCKVEFEVVHGAGHGGKQFYDSERLTVVREFLKQFPAVGP